MKKSLRMQTMDMDMDSLIHVMLDDVDKKAIFVVFFRKVTILWSD